MALPATPTARTIVMEGLKRAGSPSPTPGQIQRATDSWIPEIVNEIVTRARTDYRYTADSGSTGVSRGGNGLLKVFHTTATTVTVDNRRRYPLPTDYDDDLNITLLKGTHTDTATAGDSTTVTLAADEDISQADAEGSYIIMTAGTSIRQYRQIVGYDTTTMVATVEKAWDATKTPVSGDTYLIVDQHIPLEKEIITILDDQASPTAPGEPTDYSEYGREFYLDPPPDGVYGLRLRYYADPSLVDLTDLKWTSMLREWQRALTLGIQALAEEDNDDDRADKTRTKFNEALAGVLAREQPFTDEFSGFEYGYPDTERVI